MFRYLGLIWHDGDPVAREAARRLIERQSQRMPEWQVALDKKGFFVGYAGARAGASEPYCLEDEAGVVLGKLFEHTSSGLSVAAPLALDESRSRRIVVSRGRYLIDRYWGRYVAFLHDEARGASWVLRDPSAELPCYMAAHCGVRLYFSDIEDTRYLGVDSFNIHWQRLAAWLCMMRDPSRETGLREVSQVLGGECVELREGEQRSSFYWNPLKIATEDVIDDPLEAVKAMRHCVMDTVRAWASSYRGIALAISGGLDSSIVYAALRDSPARSKLTCFHIYPLGTDLDERHFARLVVRSGDSELLERPRNVNLSLESLLEVAASPEPEEYLHPLESYRQDAALAAERDVTAVFTGWGGDQLFYQTYAIFAAGDYLCRKGLRPGLLRVAFDSAHIDRISIWRVLHQAFREWARPGRWSLRDEMAPLLPLIRLEVFDEVYKTHLHAHPLLRESRIPSGKLWHAAQVVCPLGFYNPLGHPDDPERVSPLHSQPVMDLCLRLPLHILTWGGWDRAIARRAFYDELPRDIANRRHKGGILEHVQDVTERNIVFLRELLLDGNLVRQGIVDGRAVATALSGKPSKLRASPFELLVIACVEAWARRWQSRDALRPGAVRAA